MMNDPRNLLSELIQQYRDRADFLLIRLEESESTDVVLRNDKIETLSEEVSIGGQVRACYKGGWGFASFNRVSHIKEKIESAIAAARLVGIQQTDLAPITPVEGVYEVPLSKGDPREIPLADKKALCDHYNQILQQHDPHITTTTVSYNDIIQRVTIATTEGTLVQQSWADLEARFSAVARSGEIVQTGRETTGSRRGWEDLFNLEKQVISAGERAVNALNYPTVTGDVYPVVIDPILSGLFVHEAFGHLSEADMIDENPELQEVMTMGRKFGPGNLQIFDGAAPAGHRGSYHVDDEGTPAQTTQLIQDGILVGRLHSRETAGKLGESPTGNARCLDYQYPPLVRMTNTWMEKGDTPVEKLFQNIPLGVYAKNWLGGMTNGEMFTFSAGEAYMIRDGQIAEPVRDVTLSGNVFKTLANIEAIGNDFYWDESGGCGKGGQSGLPVGCGGPSVLIRDVVVGGENPPVA